MAIINYRIEYFHPRVKEEIENWPGGILADFARMVELLMEFGPNLRMPHSRAIGGGLFELRPRGKEGIGRVFYCTCDGHAIPVADGLAFPNGLALTADAKTLYVVNELAHMMVRYEVQEDGTLGPKEDFAPIRQGGIGGDGMALDVEGNLYLANYGTGMIDIISPEGEQVGALDAGGRTPTNVAFGGADLKDLYITETETGAVYVQRTAVAGLRLFQSEKE